MENSEKLEVIRDILSHPDSPDAIINNIKKIILDWHGPVITSKYTLEEIEQQIIDHSGISFDDLCRKTRKGEIVLYRQMAHFKAKTMTGHSLSTIGHYFGRKDHATVLHSAKSIQNYLDTDRQFREQHEIFLTT